MDSFDRYSYKSKIHRQRTPCTNYSSFSSPPISPVHFSTSEIQSQEKLSPISLTFQSSYNFQDLVLKYFFLNDQKEKVNNSCVSLLKRLETLQVLDSKMKKQSQQSDIDSKELFFAQTLDHINKLEQQNTSNKSKLASVIQTYHEKVAQIKESNFLLKEIVFKTKKIENFQSQFEKVSFQVHELKKTLTGLAVDSEFIHKQKQDLSKDLANLQKSKEEIRNRIKSTEKIKEKNKSAENTVAFIDAKTHFESNQLFNIKEKLSGIQERTELKRNDLKARKKILELRIKRYSERTYDLKRREKDLKTRKSDFSNNSDVLARLSSSLAVKETYLDHLECSLLARYEILEKTSIETMY